jgi:N-methylhydantoinase B/oxoprolinase/acetone carboxylase alpha subunit
MELIGDIRTLIAGYQATGKPIPSHRELFDSAVRMRFGDRAKQKAAEAARERVAQQLRDRSGQFVGRSNSDLQSPDADPTKRAVNALRDKWAEYQETAREE